ncbi:WD40 repeat-like protein [Paxillus ammoniavirescens]|nr:WD40 repeat-like protein [Paxillus ammoniavirescens]
MSNRSRNSSVTAEPLTTISGHDSEINKIAYLPDGNRVISCSDDKTVRVWDAKNGEQEGTTMEHEGWVQGLAVTRNGGRILSGGEDNIITVWDVETHERLEKWEGHTGDILSIALSPDDQLAASGDWDGKIVIRDMKERGHTKHSIETGSSVLSVCFSPNGKKLACAVNEHKDDGGIYVIQVYDVESGELILGPIKALLSIRRSNSPMLALRNRRIIYKLDNRGVISISLSPDGATLVSASSDKTVRFWSAYSGDPIGQPLKHESCMRAVAFSPSGQFVASGGYDKKVSTWQVPGWENELKARATFDSFLDRPAFPNPSNSQRQGEFNFLNPNATQARHPITPPSPAGSPAEPLAMRVQRFWNGLIRTHRPSSPPQQVIDLQPSQGRRFWNSRVRTPLIDVAAAAPNNIALVGRRERRKKKKRHHKSHKFQEPQAPTRLSTVEADPSLQPEQSGSTSNAGPSNSQAGPSTTSNAAPAGRTSRFVQSTTGDDRLDDMYGYAKCVDHFGFEPWGNREKFRPWKKKSRVVITAEEQAKNAKKRDNARRHPTSKATDSQDAANPPHRHGPQCDGIKPASPPAGDADRQRITQLEEQLEQLRRQLEDANASQNAGHAPHHHDSHASPAADEADLQCFILQLQEQNKQLRRQLDNVVAVMRKAGVGSGGLGENVGELQRCDHESREPLESHLPTGSPTKEAGLSSSQAEPLGSVPIAGSSTTNPPPANIPSEERPSGSMQSNSEWTEAEERANEEKRSA